MTTPQRALELADDGGGEDHLLGISIKTLQNAIEYNPKTGEFRRKDCEKSRWTFGGSNGHGYLVVRACGKYIRANRLAFALYYGRTPNGFVDHINGDRTDNRIENLREADFSQNTANSARRRDKRLPKGVHASWRSNKFQARITLNKKPIHIGTFDTAEEAAHAYNKAAISIHGEYARLNPIGNEKLIIKPEPLK